jgi:hypothetical protein
VRANWRSSSKPGATRCCAAPLQKPGIIADAHGAYIIDSWMAIPPANTMATASSPWASLAAKCNSFMMRTPAIKPLSLNRSHDRELAACTVTEQTPPLKCR